MLRILILLIATFIGESLSRVCFPEITSPDTDNFEDIQRVITFDENAYKERNTAKRNADTLCDGGFANLPDVQRIILDSKGIEKIEPGAFQNLPSLRDLIIVNNDIAEIKRGIFGDLLMRKLNLSSNGISKIERHAFENVLNLEVLDLSSNKLTVFENGWFKYTPKLYRLNFMQNRIRSIPKDAFVNVLESKEKKHNLELWFTRNSIADIHKEALNKVQKIEDLWLNDNLLASIDVEVFARVQQIRSLYLDNNKFTCFEDKFLEHLNVKELDVDGNPIDCACLNKIKAWEKASNVEVNHIRVGLQCLFEKLTAMQERKHEID